MQKFTTASTTMGIGQGRRTKTDYLKRGLFLIPEARLNGTGRDVIIIENE